MVYYIYIAAYLIMDPYSNDYYEGPLGLWNSNSAQHTHAAYLLEMGSMPPIHPQDQAFAYLKASLNSSAFSPAGNLVYDDPCELHITTTTVLQLYD